MQTTTPCAVVPTEEKSSSPATTAVVSVSVSCVVGTPILEVGWKIRDLLVPDPLIRADDDSEMSVLKVFAPEMICAPDSVTPPEATAHEVPFQTYRLESVVLNHRSPVSAALGAGVLDW